MRRALGVLVRALAGPAEEVSGHQQGDGQHHDGQEDLSMHSQLTPGQWPGTASAAKPDAGTLGVIWLYRAHGMPRDTLAPGRSIYAGSDLPRKYTVSFSYAQSDLTMHARF